MTKYAFKTIVAPEAVRADFTTLREMLETSDKELMQAFWNLGLANPEAIKSEVAKLKEQSALQRAEKQEFKAAAKLKEKAPKAKKEKVIKVAKKDTKKKAVKATKTAEVAMIVDDGDDELSCVVVDGTK